MIVFFQVDPIFVVGINRMLTEGTGLIHTQPSVNAYWIRVGWIGIHEGRTFNMVVMPFGLARQEFDFITLVI